MGVQIGFGIAHGMLAKVENRCCQNCVRTACGKTLVEMFQTPDTTRGNHRDTHCISDIAGEIEIVSCLRPIAVHAGQQNLTSAQGLDLLRPGYGVEASGRTPTMRKHSPATLLIRTSFRINGHDNALTAKHFSRFPHEVWSVHRGSIY
jgi:hypothetical protein